MVAVVIAGVVVVVVTAAIAVVSLRRQIWEKLLLATQESFLYPYLVCFFTPADPQRRLHLQAAWEHQLCLQGLGTFRLMSGEDQGVMMEKKARTDEQQI